MAARPFAVLCGLNARYVHTNLALRYLQAYVRRHWPAAPPVELLEWTINDQVLPVVRRLYRQNAPVYAFSCYIWNISLIRQIASQLKKVLPDALIVWGGPEVSYDAARRLESEPAADLIISGEGEVAFLQLLQVLSAGPAAVRLASVPGLTWRDPDSGKIHSNPPAPPLAAADWPFPYSAADLALLDNRIIYYETSRGCPFHCSYCLSALDRTVRHRPLPLVFAELDQLMAAGLQQVKLVDRTFNCDPGRAYLIWQYIIDRHQVAGRVNFHFEVAGDLLDDRTTDLLNQSPPGLIQLEIGVQTIHPAVLQAINRPFQLDQLQRQVRRLRQGGRIHLHLDLIAGLPGENLAQFGESLDWVYQLQPHQLQLGFLKVLPGSPLGGQAAARKFRWQDEPPYEILQSDQLDFGDLSLLKMVEQIIDLYYNSGLYTRSLAWLAGRWPRPWLFLREFAVWAGEQGFLEGLHGLAERSRLLFLFGLARLPELAAAGWLPVAWRDLLRLDYVASGQKDQPAWLGFWEFTAGQAEKARLQQARQVFQRRFPDCRRLRIDRFAFDWTCLINDGELRPGSWLVIYDLSGSSPAVLDNCPENDLY